jgi:hypothetical protein
MISPCEVTMVCKPLLTQRTFNYMPIIENFFQDCSLCLGYCLLYQLCATIYSSVGGKCYCRVVNLLNLFNICSYIVDINMFPFLYNMRSSMTATGDALKIISVSKWEQYYILSCIPWPASLAWLLQFIVWFLFLPYSSTFFMNCEVVIGALNLQDLKSCHCFSLVRLSCSSAALSSKDLRVVRIGFHMLSCLWKIEKEIEQNSDLFVALNRIQSA